MEIQLTTIVNDNSSNIHRAVNITTLSEKEIKKYSLVKTGDLFKKDDHLLLYDDQYVKIGDSIGFIKYSLDESLANSSKS